MFSFGEMKKYTNDALIGLFVSGLKFVPIETFPTTRTTTLDAITSNYIDKESNHPRPINKTTERDTIV
jgi:hypothetical protein